MLTILWCAVLACGPILGMWVLADAIGRNRFGLRRGRSAPFGSVLSPPIERLGHDLHRLALDFDRTEHANEPHKAARLRATSLAYDDLLLAAAWALEVPAPARTGHELLDPFDRLTVEADLARAGLSW